MSEFRKLVTVKTITNIKPIPNANNIVCAVVNDSWEVVIRRDEFTINDLALYFEIDSWIPYELAPFLCKGDKSKAKTYNGIVGEKLKTIKMCGQLSQGLLLPISYLKTNYPDTPISTDMDYSELLGVIKCEDYTPEQHGNLVRGNFPNYIPKTNQERVQNLKTKIYSEYANDLFEVTIKLDGSSFTLYYNGVLENPVSVCSRNQDLLENDTNKYWKAAKSQNIINALELYYKQTGKCLAIQGELIGEGIQGNPEKITGHMVYLFDIYSITDKKYLNPEDRYKVNTILTEFGANLPHVPILAKKCKSITYIK